MVQQKANVRARGEIVATDHYDILGVSPQADRATIRAAYVGLMRLYHPDRNPSPQAAAKVRAITAAYSVLSVAARRARYDLERTRGRVLPRWPEPIRRTRHWHARYLRQLKKHPAIGRRAPYFWAPAGAAFFAMLVWVMVPTYPIVTQVPERAHENTPAAAARSLAPTLASATPDPPCSSSAPSALIKRELFRRAAQIRGSDQAAFANLAAHSFLRVGQPLATGQGSRTSCNVKIFLALPPGVEAWGERRNLEGNVGYPSRGKPGEQARELTFVSAHVVELLATIAQAPSRQVAAVEPPPPPVLAAAAPLPPVATPRPLLVEASAPKPMPASVLPARAEQPLRATHQRTSFSCRSAKSWAANTVCTSASLAVLDRGLASLYGDSIARAPASRRNQLIQGDRRFLAYRDGCRSESCVRSAYLTRIQAVQAIMADGQAAR
ncbi:DnaJ domain-containing protein [Sphingomonas sp.]|uniref:DnaJ domain-containing protein n=1 Tax=Sphingomonas sp. TaxID=28214 RepID=UPI00286DCD93|nr:DnaJ domain-containing protein [Sphingomonas sp.]